MTVYLSPKCLRAYGRSYGDNPSRKRGASSKPLYLSPNTEKMHKILHIHPYASRLKKHWKPDLVGGGSRRGGKVIFR